MRCHPACDRQRLRDVRSDEYSDGRVTLMVPAGAIDIEVWNGDALVGTKSLTIVDGSLVMVDLTH